MPPGISGDVIRLITYLLPGFLAAWIYHGLTGHPTKSPFERTVFALILTAVVQLFTTAVKTVAVFIGSPNMGGHAISMGEWSTKIEVGWSIAIAIGIGHVVSWVTNNNWYHAKLYKYKITQRTAFVSEWFSAFTKKPTFVILHFKDGRRLLGWPYEWPDQPDVGHFLLSEPEWILKENRREPAGADEFILVPAGDVRIVEFLKPQSDLAAHKDVRAES